MYTNDTVVLLSAPEMSVTLATLETEIQATEYWLHSTTKTEAMLLEPLQKLAKISQFSVTINGSAIKHITEFKYLLGRGRHYINTH